MSTFDHFVGTREVSGKHQFDVPALENWLRVHLPGFQGPLTVSMFKGGQSNPTYKLTTAKQNYVMRAKPGPASQLLASAHAIDREFAVMQALAGTQVPVAKMHVLCEDESVIGRAFYIMDFVDGRVLWDQSLPGMTPTQRAEIYYEMNRVIAALHQADFAAKGLSQFGKSGNYFERQIGRWSKQYIASEIEPNAHMDQLMAWLPKHIPEAAQSDALTCIVHGDFRLDNLIFHPTEPKVLAVLDWELSTLGHPFADFSYHGMAWHIPPGSFRGIGGLDLKALGIPSEQEYLARYCANTGFCSPDALKKDWNFYMAYNLFRIAAILQGIAKRAQMGTASSAQAGSTSAGVGTLAAMAWQFAEKAGH